MNGWGIVLQGSIYMNKSKALLHLHLHHFLRVPKSPIRVRWYPTILPGEELCLTQEQNRNPRPELKAGTIDQEPNKGTISFLASQCLCFPFFVPFMVYLFVVNSRKKECMVVFRKGEAKCSRIISTRGPLSAADYASLCHPFCLYFCFSVFQCLSVCLGPCLSIFLHIYMYAR